jgi:hypothetical protein
MAEYRATFFDGYFHADGSYEWGLDQPVMLRSASGELIGVLQAASVSCHGDPDVSLNFSVMAGNILGAIFTITSAQVSFPTMAQCVGRTSATLSLTDLTNDGAALTPVGQPGVYTSRFNGAPPGGTTFHDSFLDQLVVGAPGGSQTDFDEFPAGGDFGGIAGAVSNIGTRFGFALSVDDQASATSIFRVEAVPGPASVGLLGLGGWAAARRRVRG